MSLRLRLSLIYTLLVAVVLSLSGFGLYFLLQRNLNAALDSSLQDAAKLLSAFVERHDDRLELHKEDDGLPELRADVVALLLSSSGQVVDSLGRIPRNLELNQLGFSSWRDWRIFAVAIPGGSLVTLREQTTHESLGRFLATYLLLAPLAVLLSFLLGYLFAGQALNPVRKATQAAYDLAQRRAWRERLPEPRSKDELFSLVQGSNALLAALENVIETEKRFTADAAHELRTPITVLQGRLEKALELVKDPKALQSLEKASLANDTLRNLVEKLLTLARAEAGQGLSKELVSLNKIAFEATEFMRSTAITKGLSLTFVNPDKNIAVTADKVALGLVLRNLLENAIKFTEHGGVTVGIKQLENRAAVSVEDTGRGIPEEAIPSLFERFFQVDVRHRRLGSGLGLALVKSIVDWHGGEIKVDNKPEGGSKFTIII